jgi:hypothetical protein
VFILCEIGDVSQSENSFLRGYPQVVAADLDSCKPIRRRTTVLTNHATAH